MCSKEKTKHVMKTIRKLLREHAEDFYVEFFSGEIENHIDMEYARDRADVGLCEDLYIEVDTYKKTLTFCYNYNYNPTDFDCHGQDEHYHESGELLWSEFYPLCESVINAAKGAKSRQ